jgi:hypothetical protein
MLAAPRQEAAGVVQAALDQLTRVGEVRRLDAQRTGRRQDDQLLGPPVSLDVFHEAPLREQTECLKRHAERPVRRLLERARVAGGEHVDHVGAEFDGV